MGATLEAVEWLTLVQAARRAGLSRTAFDYHVRLGEIPVAVVAGMRVFHPVDVDKWRASRAQ